MKIPAPVNAKFKNAQKISGLTLPPVNASVRLIQPNAPRTSGLIRTPVNVYVRRKKDVHGIKSSMRMFVTVSAMNKNVLKVKSMIMVCACVFVKNLKKTVHQITGSPIILVNANVVINTALDILSSINKFVIVYVPSRAVLGISGSMKRTVNVTANLQNVEKGKSSTMTPVNVNARSSTVLGALNGMRRIVPVSVRSKNVKEI
jgi:hypothetical protein